MANSNVCRLCKKLCIGSLRLQDINGHYSEIYKIAIQYFEPKFVNVEHGAQYPIALLCMSCWQHISDFHNFRQTIMLVQANLFQDAEKVMATVVEKESRTRERKCSISESGSNKKSEATFGNELIVPDQNDETKSKEPTDRFDETQSPNSSYTDRFNASEVVIKPEFDVTELMECMQYEGGQSSPPQPYEEYEYEYQSENSTIYHQPMANYPSSLNPDLLKVPSKKRYSKNPKQRKKLYSKSWDDLDPVIAQWKPVVECYMCSEKFTLITGVRKHFMEKHPSDVFYFTCCDRQLSLRHKILEHARHHLCPTKCPLCHRRFQDKFSFSSHMFYLHKQGEFPKEEQEEDDSDGIQRAVYPKCGFCGMLFEDHSKLREHLTTHQGLWDRKCIKCSLSFRIREELYQHLKSVHPLLYAAIYRQDLNPTVSAESLILETMAGSNVCRLCRSSCNDSLRLHDAKGRPNGVYEITSKYFHPKYLNVERGATNPIAALCIECWRRISVFNNFQQTVKLLLDNLLDSEDQSNFAEEPPPMKKNCDMKSNIITIDDDDEEPTTSSAGFGSGQLIVSENGIEFSNDTSLLTESTNQHEYVQDDNYIGEVGTGGGDVFIVDELDQWEPEPIDDIDNENYHSPVSPENITPDIDGKSQTYLNLSIDQEIAKWKPFLDCYVCPRKFPNFLSVKHHFAKDHPNNDFHIKCCGRKIKYRYRVHEHAVYHLNPLAFQCKECGQCFTAKSTLDGHLSSQHYGIPKKRPAKNDRCKYCLHEFTQKGEAYHHLKNVHPDQFGKRKYKERSNVVKVYY
ncbi:uncharacterized protein LOC142230999 [Haematobia irritans]|uniref:uncharacterized protein LOC142230999 n=1 Tax=Haematobia irritans TaxID=7368 RepID=UPI003F507AF4